MADIHLQTLLGEYLGRSGIMEIAEQTDRQTSPGGETEAWKEEALDDLL